MLFRRYMHGDHVRKAPGQGKCSAPDTENTDDTNAVIPNKGEFHRGQGGTARASNSETFLHRVILKKHVSSFVRSQSKEHHETLVLMRLGCALLTPMSSSTPMLWVSSRGDRVPDGTLVR